MEEEYLCIHGYACMCVVYPYLLLCCRRYISEIRRVKVEQRIREVVGKLKIDRGGTKERERREMGEEGIRNR